MKSAAKERSEVEGNGAIRIQIGRKRPELLFRWKLLPNLVHSSIPEPRGGGTIHSFYILRSTIAFVIGSTITSSKIISSTQNRVYSIYIYNI